MPSQVFRNDETGALGRFHLIRGEQRFIPDDPEANPALGTGSTEAALIAAGSFVKSLPKRLKAVTGDEQARADVREEERLLAPLREQNPIATAIGEAIPGIALPGAKVAQTVAGAAEGALLDPENPFLGAVIGGTGAAVGGVIGEKLGRLVLGRGQSAAATLARRGIPTTLAQRNPGSGVARAAETGLEAIPVLSHWVAGPARAQQRALNRGAAQALGFEGTLNKPGLKSAKQAISAKFDDVANAIEPVELAPEMIESLTSLNIIGKGERELMDLTGQLDGEGLMRVRSALNSEVADLALDGKMPASRALRIQLGELDRLIEGQIGDDAIMASWREARGQWRFLTALTKGQAISGDGTVNLRSMKSALNTVYPGFKAGSELPGGAQGFGELIDALDELPKALASSGTAERAASAAILTGAAPVTGGTTLALPALAAATAASQPGVRAGAAAGRAATSVPEGAGPVEQFIQDAISGLVNEPDDE